MKNLLLWVLVVANALLLAMFFGRGHENIASAQQQQQKPLAAGSYLAVPGAVVGGAGSDVVYILDTRNQILTAVQQNKASINAMAPIDLTRIFRR
jgi:hypothetical protein